MVMIALRAYHRQIEEWIDQGLYDQAIAHCRHILNVYPKSIDTYRLLGKAFLENQRYGDATDIFQRVLSSVPDDFISHVGMSIIREDEGNLTEAIWHMERAFEIQPSNNAIQGELRRLYGRRDGIEPPKVNLNRGALARMYIKGNLHSQAIAELRMALTEDPQRPDLQVLLAKAYLETNQYSEAAEIANQILDKLPFCFEALRVLREVSLSTQKATDAQQYQKTLSELDPYTEHLSELTSSPDAVPDTAVMVEKLDQTGTISSDQIPSQPEWATSLGITMNLEDEKSAMPDWMDEIPSPESSDSGLPSQESSEETQPSALPEWMREAGWQESSGEEIVEPISPFTGEEIEEIEPAEIPDWLKEISPQDETPETPAAESEIEAAPWLQETPPVESDSVATWLSNLDETSIPAVQPEENLREEVPDWLQDLTQKSGIEAEVKFQADAQPVTPEEPPTSEPLEVPSLEELPDWLKTAFEDTTQPSSNDLPDWLKEETPAARDELPDWLISDKGEESLEPQVPEPLILEEDTKPVFIHRPEETPAEPISPPSAQPEIAGQTPEDEAFAWLESLAAKQGADEALLLSPEERRDQPPEWIREYLETQPEEEKAAVPHEEGEFIKEEEVSPVLSEDIEAQSVGEAAIFEAELEANQELPDWLTSEATEPFSSEVEESVVESIKTELPTEEIPDWLKEFELPTEQPSPAETVETAVTAAIDESIVEEREAFQVPPLVEQTPTEIKTFAEEEILEPIEPPQPQEEPQAISQISVKTIEHARRAIQSGDLEQALTTYQELIRQRAELDQIITDLNDTLYHHPMDVKMWMLLGDAYVRKNMLTEALNAYNKAEELIR